MSKQLTEEQILKRRASQKQAYHKNPEPKRASSRQRYKENSQAMLAQQAIYRAENRDVINAKQREKYHEKRLAEKLAILQGNNL